MQRLKNRQAYLESGSRKQRTHRLITRGAAIESIAPQTNEPQPKRNLFHHEAFLRSTCRRGISSGLPQRTTPVFPAGKDSD